MRVGISAANMWSEASYRNAGISRFGFRLIDALVRNPQGRQFEAYTNVEFEPPASWTSLATHAVVPGGRGKKALWESFGAGKICRSGKHDVWLATSHSVPFRSKIPNVAMIHDMIPMVYPQFCDRLQAAYLQFMLVYASKRSTHIITNSEATRGEIVKYARVSPDKITVLPLGPGSTLTRRDPPSVKPNELADIPFKRFLLTLGTLEPRKNIPTLLKAMAMLQERGALEDLGLVIAGGRGWKEQGIFDQLEQMHIRDRVAFVGYVPDERLPALFASCDAFIYPSLLEGFGMPILEAMICGAPVLTTGQGAMKEVGGTAARYFDPLSVEEMAKCIEQSVFCPEESREAWAQKGFERAKAFSWENCAEKTIEALEKVRR
ncbi:MAG TPA: glycosyltransferase family 1 protein [Fimbriimonas sp.]|nr:glycosyltransferase family 1 protein [Fimbriimonas sp.]